MNQAIRPKYVGNPRLEHLLKKVPLLKKAEFIRPDPSRKAIKKHYFNVVNEAFSPRIYGTQLIARESTWQYAQTIGRWEFKRVEDVFTYLFSGREFRESGSDIKIKNYSLSLPSR